MCLRQLSGDNGVWIYILFQVIDRLSGVGVSGEVCKVIGGCVSVRSEEVRTQLLRDTAKVSPSSLSDFDWKLKVSLFIPHLIQGCIYIWRKIPFCDLLQNVTTPALPSCSCSHMHSVDTHLLVSRIFSLHHL